jgi:glycosyltransferase involved in cell wall biosynthesis
MRICFFAHTPDKEMLDRVEFYRQDIDILRSLGMEVSIATRWSEIPWNADLYYIWWWTWAFMPLVKAMFMKKPVIITGSFDHPLRDGRWEFDRRPFLHKVLIRWALKRADANVFVSQLEYAQIPARHWVTRPVYIPHIVDAGLYRPGNKPEEDIIFTVAWMQNGNSERKCIPEVIKAAGIVLQAHPELHFVIAGEKGTDYPGLARLAESLGISRSIEFTGVISREQKIELLQRCKAYVQPTRYEGFGLAILEAMSCGAPVITSPAGAVPEVVGDAALMVDGNSPMAIANAIRLVVEDDTLRLRLREEGRRRAQSDFPFERRRKELGDIIESVL